MEAVLNKNDMDMVEAYILRILVEKQEAIGTTDKALGEQAFNWVKYPNMKIQAIKGKGGKARQQLRFTDIVNLCEALGLPWQEVCRESLKMAKGQGRNE